MKHPALSRTIRILLLLFAALSAMKILFAGYDLDEQYALAMSYRLLKGDCPVRDMWEPHQTSAFLASFLMLPYVSFTGSTSGIVLYLRICGLAIHGLTAFLFYRQILSLLGKHTSMEPDSRRDTGLLIVGIYFFSLPKLMFFPEFSNMQLWFLLLMILCISHYYTQIFSGSKVFSCWLSAAGLCLSLEVLSYPSSLLLFPACIYYIVRYRKLPGQQTVNAAPTRASLAGELLSFCLPCMVLALLFGGSLLTRMTWRELVSYLPYAASDGSHPFSLKDKLLLNGRSLLEVLCFLAVYGLISLGISALLYRRQKQPASFRAYWGVTLLMVTLAGQLAIWILGKRYPNYPSVEYFFVPALAPILMPRRSEAEKMIAFPYITLPLLSFAGIVLMTNHPLLVSAPFLGICTAGVLLCLFLRSGREDFPLPNRVGECPSPLLAARGACCASNKFIYAPLRMKKAAPLLRTALVLWMAVLLFGKCYMVRTTGGMHYTLFHPVSIMRQGPAAGILADTGTVRQYKASRDLIQEALPGHSKVLYIGTSNGIYLMGDMEFCTPSTISSPTFDEKMETYFSLHPEKYPEYIICDPELASLDGADFLSDFLRENCAPEPVAENDFLVIYRTVGNPQSRLSYSAYVRLSPSNSK